MTQHGVQPHDAPQFTVGCGSEGSRQVAVQALLPQLRVVFKQRSTNTLQVSSQDPSVQLIVASLPEFCALNATVHAYVSGQLISAPAQLLLPEQSKSQAKPCGQLIVSPEHELPPLHAM